MTRPDFHESPLLGDPCVNDISKLHEAALSVTSELSLPKLLQKIVDLARDLVNADYAALGVSGPDGSLEQILVSGVPTEAIPEIKRTTGKGLLQDIASYGRLLRERAGRNHGAAFHDHAAPHVQSFLGVPIISRGQIIGMFYLANKIGLDQFCDNDQESIEMLAAYAAVAIQNAKLYHQIQRLAILEERERIGMDLHDGIIQSIFAVGLTLEHGMMMLDEVESDELNPARSRLRASIDGLNQIIRDIRNYILDLRPQKMRPDDLVGSLRRIVEEFQANTLVDITLDVPPGIGEQLSEAVSTALFLITQESLANAAKHAYATQLSVSIALLSDKRHITVTIEDNGVGFPTGDTEAVVGHGLSNMELRAQAVNGKVAIDSQPGKGTTIVATLPITKS